MEDQIIYPNAPLKEVDFEIKFNGELSILKNLDLFQEMFRIDFPKLYIPNAIQGKPYGLEPVSLRSVDEKSGIFIALNKLGYYTFDYNGFDELLKRISFISKKFIDLYPRINSVNRIGLRYNNVILADDMNAKFEDYLDLHFSNNKIPKTIIDIDFVNTYQIDCIQLTIMCKTILTPTKQKTILLDFDCFSEKKDKKVGDIVETLTLCHQTIKDAFMGIITDRYRKFMIGEE